VFRNTHHVHLVAIGGIGMSGIAELLLNLGFKVSGSDLRDGPVLDRLRRLGAAVYVGHDASQVAGADVVVYSSAVSAANPELQAARRAGIPVIRRAEMLAELMRLKQGIAVAGSHGKTTTTSLVASVLAEGGLDPTVLVGGRLVAEGTNAVLGGGEWLVAEADESDGSFLHLTPTLAVVTNLDLEHVDHYPDLESLREAFRAFLGRVPFYGACILCADDPELRALAPALERKVVTYGTVPEAMLRGEIQADGSLALFRQSTLLGTLRPSLPGGHNRLNALAAAAVGLELGVPFNAVARALAAFPGVQRRYQRHGDPGGVAVVDDYAHHPTEIAATLAVARDEGRPVVVLFQPHRYTRTARFHREFGEVLAGADRVGLLPVYPAGEEPPPGVDSSLVAAAVAAHGTPVELLPDADTAVAWVKETVRPGELLLVLGAGDVGRLVGRLVDVLEDGAP